MNKCILTFIIIIFTTVSWAETFYIKNGGNDSLSGKSDAEAWATLDKFMAVSAAGRLRSGDAVLLKKGSVWPQEWALSGLYGENNKPILLSAYGEGAVPVVGCLRQSGSREHDIIIDGLSFVPQECTAADSVLQIYGASRLVIRNSSVTDNGQAMTGLITVAGNGENPLTGLVIENNSLSCFYQGGEKEDGAYGINVVGAHAGVQGALIQNNTVSDCSEIGIEVYTSENEGPITGSIIRGNKVFRTHLSRGAGHGINVGYFAQDTLVEKNYVEDNDVFGIVCDTAARDIIIRNNIAYNDTDGGIGIAGGGLGPVRNLKIYNNIVKFAKAYGIYFNMPDGAENVAVRNNIIISRTPYFPEIMMEGETATKVSGFSSDYNLFYEQGTGELPEPAFKINQEPLFLFSERQDSQRNPHGYEQHSRVGDPLLTETYALLPGSPAIAGGVFLPEVPDDFWGTLRPSGEDFDIGVFKFKDIPQ